MILSMRQRRARAASAVALALCVACSYASGPEPLTETIGPLAVPLTVGTRWTFETVDSVEFGQSAGISSSFVVTATKDTVIGTRRGVVLDWGRIIADGLLGHIAMMQTSQGLFTAYTTNPYLPPPGSDAWQLRFAYPVRRGLSSSGWVVTAPDTTITVPYGAVRAVRYDLLPQSSGESSMTVFVAPTLGIVYSTRGLVRTFDARGVLVNQYRLVNRLVRVTPPQP